MQVAQLLSRSGCFSESKVLASLHNLEVLVKKDSSLSSAPLHVCPGQVVPLPREGHANDARVALVPLVQVLLGVSVEGRQLTCTLQG